MNHHMHAKNNEIAFECLNSIGNSFELESMISEIMITYYRQTKAIYACYCKSSNYENISINIGKDYRIDFDIKEIESKKCFSFKDKQHLVVILPLKIGFLTFVYKNRDDDLNYLIYIINRFQQKINFAISACIGVEELENFNKELERKVEQSIKKISEHEKLLLVKSKNIVMGEMIEMIAHQWRQPVTTIGMISNNVILNMLLDELDTDILKADLEGINKQVKYLSDTIDDFRNFFKESKEKEEFILSDVVQNSIVLLEKQFSKANVNLIYEDECQDTKLITFKSELIQALINIVANAKEAFTEDKTSKYVKVRCYKDDENIFITIEDNAGGIKPDVINQIFDPYFSTKKQKNGTGLGLYVCKIIICEHLNGDLSVKNHKDGAKFEIVLPIKNLSSKSKLKVSKNDK